VNGISFHASDLAVHANIFFFLSPLWRSTTTGYSSPMDRKLTTCT